MLLSRLARRLRRERLSRPVRRRTTGSVRTESRLESLESRVLLAAQIQGTVYHDVNADGVRQQTEDGLPNWTVFLDQNQNGSLDVGEASTQSDADGQYRFTGLPDGNYRVAEIIKPDWTATNPASGFTDVTITAGQDEQVNFLNEGTAGTSTITGNVWRDVNNDTVKDPEDTPLANWTIFLDLNKDGTLDPDEPYVLTDGNGDYTFTGVLGGAPGNAIGYEVTEIVPTGWEPRDINISAEVVDGETVVMPDFSNWPDPEQLTSVSGRVFNDVNGNGIQDAGESGLSGWRVFADLNLNNTFDTGEPFGTTSVTGNYSVVGVEAGTVRIAEVQHVDFRPTSLPRAFETSTLVGATSTANFGNQLRTDAAIGGVIYVDRDKNGVRDPGEEGLSGIVVYLDLNNDGVRGAGEPSVRAESDLFYAGRRRSRALPF
ncbi:MAG: SdrD B-like domain-containing protein [Planctomycetaceae bacterium]